MSFRLIVKKLGHLLAHPGTMVVVAFLIRYGVFWYLRSKGPFPANDIIPTMGYETGRIARSLAGGLGYSSPLVVESGPTAWMTPLFPLILAGVFKLFGIMSFKSFLIITAMDCAFSALTAWVIWAIARRAFNSASAVTAGWIWTLLPSAVFYPVAWVWDTSLSALIFALIMLASMRLLESERVAAWAGYGALWGIGAMINASIVSTLPFLLGWDAKALRARSGRWLKLTVVALLLFAVVIAPWFIRNYAVFHRLILFRSNFGLELWLGNNNDNPGIWAWWLHPNDDDKERRLYVGLGEIAYMNLKQKEAVAWIRQHPAGFVEQTFRRFVDNWTGFDEPATSLANRPFYVIVGMSLEVLFPLLALPGVLLAYRRRSTYAFPFGSAIFFFPVVYYITHTSLRYRHPIDPVLCVLAGFSAASACSWAAGRVSGKRAYVNDSAGSRELAPASK
ncbi:MAG TPA: glycosyltransferase family 39 protein [Bryobacteraceae bacterium]|nr:glycosyltransferase family 39 protein [Bryobacteraceae bacterium]